MCLQFKYNKERKDEVIDGKDEMTVYKVVIVDTESNDKLPPFSVIPAGNKIPGTPYKDGLNEADTNRQILKGLSIEYTSGFHFFKNEADARKTSDYLFRHFTGDGRYVFEVLNCTVKTDWITAIGEEWGIKTSDYNFDKENNFVVIIAEKAIFNLLTQKI